MVSKLRIDPDIALTQCARIAIWHMMIKYDFR